MSGQRVTHLHRPSRHAAHLSNPTHRGASGLQPVRLGGLPERTIDTTSPGSRASPASLPHRPLRYTLSGCGMVSLDAIQLVFKPPPSVGAQTVPSAAFLLGHPHADNHLAPASAQPFGSYLLGRLQAAHVAQVLQALPHHGALERDQHDEREQGVVPAEGVPTNQRGCV